MAPQDLEIDKIKHGSLELREGPMLADWDFSQILPKLENKVVDYIEQQEKSKNSFFLYFPLTAPHTPVVPDSNFHGQSGAGLYGDFVEQVDYSILSILMGKKYKSPLREATIHYSASGNFAISKGDWVYIDVPTGDDNKEPDWLREQFKVAPLGTLESSFNAFEFPYYIKYNIGWNKIKD